MMNLKEVGTYLDRRIMLQEAGSLKELTATDLSSAVVLMWIADRSWDAEELRRAIEEMSDGKPLSLVVSGERADESFSLLLETLSYLPPASYHIMTGSIENTDMSEAVSEFLIATYPEELRFDDWQEYRVVAVGNPDLEHRMLRSISKATSRLAS
jgi:hypothetical protein